MLESDRQGPNVSFAFRIEAIETESLIDALNPMDPQKFPLRNYVLGSEQVSEFYSGRGLDWSFQTCASPSSRVSQGHWEVSGTEAGGQGGVGLKAIAVARSHRQRAYLKLRPRALRSANKAGNILSRWSSTLPRLPV